MSENTLYDKVWDKHKGCTLPTGKDQIFIGLHLIHEVTSPQAFAMLREAGLTIAYPDRTIATVDHIVPTQDLVRPFEDEQAEVMISALEENVDAFGVQYLGLASGKQGIVHVIGPELGLTQPGMTIACGDSHTSTHGAFGCLAFGIGTTEVRNVLATQTLALDRLKVHRINFSGQLQKNVYAKDIILKIIQELGVGGGKGHAYEYGGQVFDSMSMEERMTVCNMSIEGGARIGYVNPDQTTIDYLTGRERVPEGDELQERIGYWRDVASGKDATYDKQTDFDASRLEPIVTWGINPGQSVNISARLPRVEDLPDEERETAQEAYAHMGLEPGNPIYGTPINVGFIGSCTNSRISDLREAAKILEGNKVADNVQLLVVPGSQQVKLQAEEEGLDDIFTKAGTEWRGAGCSMCLAMNPDKLVNDQRCISSSNRNFIGRQGSKKGRTHLSSPAMVASSAIAGEISDMYLK